MKPLIHPSAIVSPKAVVHETVEIGPFCVVEDDVVVGKGTKLSSHVVLADGCRIGDDVRIHHGAVIGGHPQDLKFSGESTLAVIGNNTVIREFVTVNRGTSSLGQTTVGSNVLLMSYVHVAHDCVIGDKVIIANSTQLGGHVTVGYHATIGGLTGVHQFCSIGSHVMIAGTTFVTKDIPPYTLAGRDPICIEGLNTIGLRRRGFTTEEISALQHFYRKLYKAGLNVSDALASFVQLHPTPDTHVQQCIDFIQHSTRGIARFHS